ncbi:uncharacterized protein GGS22DRAFT_96352 [Annulohypoxylon maeteangense]|uniref:uncharacterized protein n=1 Tax=Annulohypoxylon maeteangense TaxID=1927788 RepID=UPI00200868E7|nr:uncharacterized protein GGS22DRAFT_96352 [Annulohypoxylon maeteangense]KAI0888361.1 hypothetical protein GGS22DRAFT_96352 [Annulohypoxylon maeteangense]
MPSSDIDDDELFGPDESAHNEQYGGQLTESAELSEEEKAWKGQELDQQCKDVLNLLSQNKRRWDSSVGSQETPILEEYKKRTLAERKGDSNEPLRATALHVLARSKAEFYAARKDVCKQLIRYLIENRVKDTDEPQFPDGKKKMLVLEVALVYENDEFIDCVEECLGDKFPDFLHLQDDNKRNCLHHLFAWPFERSGKKSLPQKSPEDNKLYLIQLRKLAPKAKPETLASADNEGNTPIHYAMHVKQCNDRGYEYIEIVQDLILRADELMIKNKTLFNKKGESPIMYCRNVIIAAKEEKKKNDEAKQKSVPPPTKEEKALNQPQRPESRAESQFDGSGSTKKAQQLASQGAASGNQYVNFGIRNRDNRNYAVENQIMGSQAVTMNTSATLTSPSPFPEGHRLQKAPTIDTSQDRISIQYQSQMPPPSRKRGPPTPITASKAGLSTGGSKPTRGNTTPPATTGAKAAKILSDFLKAHYTGTRSDLDARDLIYGRGADGWATNLYFDARGLQDTKKVLELLDRMKAGGFSTILSYVSIPVIRHVPVVPSAADNVDVTNPRPGRTDLVDVFNKLYDELNVREILRLEVEDRHKPSHTDAAIEKAIQGRDSTVDQAMRKPISIHTWDWRKPDLSTDVIAFAAPTIKVVHLYWSGNQTVLKAWGCSEGIPRLHSTTGVEKVVIHTSPGLETIDRMKTAIKRFKDALKETYPNVEFIRSNSGRDNKDKLMKELLRRGESQKVQIEFIYNNQMGDYFANINTGEEASEYIDDDSTAKQHVWVDAMDRFRSALASMIPQVPSPTDRVRVALIDDGVNLGSVDMYGGIVNVNGLSFHPSDRQTENPWHYSSGGHGTIMANMILRINPWVDLFVIKIHCGVAHNHGRTISAHSAAEAIRAAIDLKVRIISVSWTIKYRIATGTSSALDESDPSKPAKKDAFTQLREAINEVKNNGIIMFCSASDDIQTTAMKVLPYSQQPEHIFRIGAALWLGQRDPTTETPDRIDWYFPGNQVAEAKNPRSQAPVKYHDGSSAGTALAAGLASLIMYLARLLQTRHAETKEAKLFKDIAKDLEDRTKMKQALDMIGKKGNYQQDKKYLPVWDIFNPATEILTSARDAGPKWDALKKLVMSLCLEDGR